MLIVSESVISVTSFTRSRTISTGGYASFSMEVSPSSPLFTGYWTRRGLDGIERRIVIDNVKYMSMDQKSMMIMNVDANDVGFYTLYVTNGVDSGHTDQSVILRVSGTFYVNLDIYVMSVLQMTTDNEVDTIQL